MSCNNQPTNCAPCSGCTPTPPVMPRCDVVLPDGVYPWATLVVENGCITGVQPGQIPAYTPDPCCDTPGGGGGGDEPCDCPPGEPGENATITPGQTFSVPYGQPPNVVNVGTPTNAVLDFYIPAGKPGDDNSGGSGVSDDRGGIIIENGLVVGLPATWPPALYINPQTPQLNVQFQASAPDPTTGVVTLSLNLSQFDQALRDYTNSQVTAAVTPLQGQITALQQTITAMQQTITQIQNKLNTCCP